MLSRAVLMDPPPDSEIPPELGYVLRDRRRRDRRAGADRGDGAARGRAARRAGVRRGRAPPAAVTGADGRKRGTPASAKSRARQRCRARASAAVLAVGARDRGVGAAADRAALQGQLARPVRGRAAHRRDRCLRAAQRTARRAGARLDGRAQDVVAVLAGRRGDQTALRSPVLGVLCCRRVSSGRRTAPCGPMAGSCSSPARRSWPCSAWSCSSRSCSSARPAAFRCPHGFAVRDAARHRSRTAPAVAAVAATVAGVVALGIGGDERRRREPGDVYADCADGPGIPRQPAGGLFTSPRSRKCSTATPLPDASRVTPR